MRRFKSRGGASVIRPTSPPASGRARRRSRPDARGGRRGRRRRRPRARPSGSAPPSARRSALNLSSRAPATISTGIDSAARSDHSGRCAPVPARRRLAASPAAVFARRPWRPAAAGDSVVNIGSDSHRSRNAATPSRSTSSARCSSAARRAARSLIVLDAGGGADEYEPLDPFGGRDRKLQRDAAAHRVADVGR